MVQSATPLRVLVVEDDPDTAESLRALVGCWGHDVLVAADPAAAVTLATAFRPVAVLLDLGRPPAHGFEVARRLRELPWDRAPVLVAATGPEERAVRLRAWEAGCTHFLPAPLDAADLRAILNVPPPRARGDGVRRAARG